jgi:uncharacterized membrane protein (UPF0127 family)
MMSLPGSTGYAFNRTRQTSLATHLTLAATHWSRFCGLMGRKAASFCTGDGLWIVPCRGVHTFAMKFPIDVIYLDTRKRVVHIEENLRPWRVAKVSFQTVSVLELPPHTLRSTQTTIGDEIDIEMGQARGASTT